jgi:molybdenum cofactor biosynthesis enzyme MoaA
MSTRIPFQWNTANFKWDAISPTDGKTYPPNETVTGTNRWDDCALIIELINVGGKGLGSYLKKHAAFLSGFLPYVTELRISFDAGTADTYSRLRANGDWLTLLDNVRFVKQLIDQQKFATKLTADFVVQTDNYKEIPEFIKTCQDIGIININLQKMWNWGTTSQEEFDRNNIYNPAHPEYNDLKQIFESIGQKIKF